MRLRRLVLPAGAAAGLLVLWVVNRPDDEPRTNPELRVASGAPREDTEHHEPAPQDTPRELPPPEPVLQQSAQRRFSSPAAHGASGGIAGAEPAAPAPSVGRQYGGVNFPGGYAAPTASIGPGYASGSASAGAGEEGRTSGAPDRAPDVRADRRPKKDDADEGSAPEEGAPGDRKSAGAAAKLVGAARELKARDDAAAMRTASSAEAGIMRQLERDQKVDKGIRGAIERLNRSGRPVTMDAVMEAAEDVLSENGLTPEDVDLPMAVALAAGPPPADIPPAALGEAVKAIVNIQPLEPFEYAEVQRLADNPRPPPPRAPAPRGALDAFRKHEGVFEKALDDFGVKPEHILGILGVETTWGRNTGKFPLPATLLAISQKTGPNGRPTKAAIQAGRDLAALARLSASGNLGGLTPDQVRGSYAGAMGIPQFLPTSWEAYSRSPDGGKRDPFNFGTAAYSVGNYLRLHGYSRDVPRSIWGYNHSQEYVDKVLGLSADVKASLKPAAAK